MNKLIFIIILTLALAIETTAQRIVSLSPSVTYTLKQIGADDKVVGRTNYCPQNDKSTIIGDVLSINIETIIALKPDVVFCMQFTKPQTVAQLKNLGIRVITLDTPHNFEEICRQTLDIAREAKCLDEATKLVEHERIAVDNISNKAKKNAGKMLFQVGTRPLFAVTKDYYLNEIIERVGCTNICTEISGGCSREFVVRENPNFIIITTMGGLAADEVKEWNKLLKARCLIVNEDEAGCPTPTFYRQTLEKIATFVANK